jgi:hypothetical protein
MSDLKIRPKYTPEEWAKLSIPDKIVEIKRCIGPMVDCPERRKHLDRIKTLEKLL